MPADSTPPGDTAVARVRLERDRVSLLLEVTNLLVSQLDLGDLFHALSGCLDRAVRHEYASISLFEPGTGTSRALVRLVVTEGSRRPDLENRSIPISESFWKGEATIYTIEDLEARNPVVARILGPLGMRSFCSIPLTTARAAVGILSVASRRPDAFTEDEVVLLRQVSGQIAIAVENGLAYEEIQRLKDRLLSEKMYLEDDIRTDHGFAGITGRSLALRQVLTQVETVAPTDASVLLTGETGTGKELIARAIHNRSGRRDRAFVRVNCAAIPSTLIESEMFGHERGAFTGAVATRLGRFEVAHGGTLFLDEVGDLPSICNRSSCGRSRNTNSSGSVPPRPFVWTCGSLPPPTVTCRRWWPRARFATICITA